MKKAYKINKRINYLTTLFIVIFLFILGTSKLVLGIIDKENLIIISAIYNYLVLFAKSIFLISYKSKKEINENILFLIMSIFAFLASLCFFIYWVIAIQTNYILSFTNFEFIYYLLIGIGEIIVSIFGLLMVNRNKDILIYGLKCISLLNALTYLELVVVYIVSFTSNGVPSRYAYLYFVIIIPLYMLICGIKKIIKERKDKRDLI